jgi:glycerol-3-phosphate O-acyltransferase
MALTLQHLQSLQTELASHALNLKFQYESARDSYAPESVVDDLFLQRCRVLGLRTVIHDEIDQHLTLLEQNNRDTQARILSDVRALGL